MSFRPVPAILLGFIALAFTCPALAAPLQENQTLKLPSGRTVRVLSVSKIEYSKGVMALMVRYQTTLSVEERKLLSEEVDDVWKLAEKQVERLGYHEAILSSTEVTRGIFLTANRMQNFIFERGPDGKWTRLASPDLAAQ